MQFSSKSCGPFQSLNVFIRAIFSDITMFFCWMDFLFSFRLNIRPNFRVKRSGHEVRSGAPVHSIDEMIIDCLFLPWTATITWTYHPLRTCDSTQFSDQANTMSGATETHGGNTAGDSERNTPVPSGAATPVSASGSRPPSRTHRFLAKAEKKIDKFKLKLGLKEKGTESHGASEASTTAASKGESTTSSTGKTWAVVAGALKMTLSGAVPFIPDPFKGPAEALLKIIDVFEVRWSAFHPIPLANKA